MSDLKTIKFKYVCDNCKYENSVEYSWPERLYDNLGYNFITYCSECLAESKYEYIEEDKEDSIKEEEQS